MPSMMINGQWVETPVGYNPLTDPSNPMYQPPGVVQAANAGTAGWGSQNVAATPGNPFGLQYDPRFQANSDPRLNNAYTDWTRMNTGQQTLQAPVIGGMAGQQYGAGTLQPVTPQGLGQQQTNLTNMNRQTTAQPAQPMTPGANTQTPQASRISDAPASIGESQTPFSPPSFPQPAVTPSPQVPQGGQTGAGTAPYAPPPQQQFQAPQWWSQAPIPWAGGQMQGPQQGYGMQSMSAPPGGFGGLGGMAVNPQSGMAQGVGSQMGGYPVGFGGSPGQMQQGQVMGQRPDINQLLQASLGGLGGMQGGQAGGGQQQLMMVLARLLGLR